MIKNSKIILVVFLSFISLTLSLIPALVSSYAYIFSKYLKSSRLTSLLSAIFLAVINSTKFLESDLLRYANDYNFGDFSFENIEKEPLYFLLKFLFTEFNIDFQHFVFFTSFFFYFLIFKCIEIICKKKFTLANSLILMVCFMPEVFSLSAHLIRQMMSISLFIYGITTSKKKYMFLSIFLHSSSLLFICLHYMIEFFKNPKKTILYIIFLVIISLLLIQLDIQFINYFIYRFQYFDFFASTEKLSNLYLYLCYVYPIIALIFLFVKKHSKEGKKIIELSIASALAVALLSQINDLLAYRIFYSFLILLIVVIAEVSKHFKYSVLLISFFVVINVVRFSVGFKNLTWEYNPIFKYLLNPFNL